MTKKKNRAEREREKHNQVESREFSFSSAIQRLLNDVLMCVKVNRLQRPSCAPRSREVWSSETSQSFAMWWDERAIPRRCHQNINLFDCLPQNGTNEKVSGQKVRGYINRQSLMTCNSSLISWSPSYLSPQWIKESVWIQWESINIKLHVSAWLKRC